MRIPPSLVVMSLVTATPFALGIRDVVLHKQPSDKAAQAAEIRDRLERTEIDHYEAQARQEAEEAAATHKANRELVVKLYGTKPATLGLLFGDTLLGMAAPISPTTQAALDKAGEDKAFLVYPVREKDVLEAVRIEIVDRSFDDDGVGTCEVLGQSLRKAWGPSTNGAWIDEATRQRAVISEDGCDLTFERILPVGDWVDQLPAVTSKGVRGDALIGEGETMMAGIGYGDGPTAVTSYTDEGGKAFALRISARTDFSTLTQIRDALSKKLHAQPTVAEGDTAVWTWKKAPGYVLEEDGENHFSLVIGKDPTL